MPTITLKTLINAPIERCFDLARSIDLHVQSMRSSKEEAISGTTSGLIDINETVTWKARHFGINFTMTSKVTKLDKPYYFVDEMMSGPFKKLHHQHIFKTIGTSTEMTDVFEFETPFGLTGLIVERLFLKSYMKNLLLERNRIIKGVAE
ncbi:cell division protein [Pedobacter chinensis]|uniref:Cell division protein n=1 Tax=Pedobacter chinensis TaxID=2282421 RepID=A0A369PWQ7_9SPHI|nr:SRPBCC family protein [Pedobacter chinensis]RDC57063.1 cell division protein [Pedobacter chinensis]